MNGLNRIVDGVHKPQTRRQPIVTTLTLWELCVDNVVLLRVWLLEILHFRNV